MSIKVAVQNQPQYRMSRPPLYLLHGIKSDGKWQKLIPSYMEPMFRCIPLTYREYNFLGALKIVFWPWAIVIGLLLLFANKTMDVLSWMIHPISLATYVMVIFAEIRWLLSFSSREGFHTKLAKRKVLYILHTVAFFFAESLLVLLVLNQSGSSTTQTRWLLAPCLLMIFLLEMREALNSIITINILEGKFWNPAVQGAVYYLLVLVIGGSCLLILNEYPGVALCCFVQLSLWVFALAIEPKIRSQRVIGKVSAQIRWNRITSDERPSLIAHSFGTKIIVQVLESTPGISIEKLILVGCVLPENYDWSRLLNNSRVILNDVRNEYGRRDIVVRWLAWLVGYLPGTGLGRAGYSGFKGNSVIVHQVDGPLSTCKYCNTIKQKAVHNVALDEYGHNGWFLEIDHARDLWIPHLFGINPVHYHEFQNLCKRGANAVRSKDWGTYNIVEIELRESRWVFESHNKNGSLLEELIIIDTRLACPEFAGKPQKVKKLAREMEATVVLILILEVVQACIESESGPDKNWESIQWSLNPRKAVTRAVNTRVSLLRENGQL